MRRFLILLVCLVPCSMFGDDDNEPSTLGELQKHLDQRVTLSGSYQSPGKGPRTIDCGFVVLHISDYSFYTKSDQGFLVTELNDGDRIRFTAKITYFKGSRSLVATHPSRQEILPPKQTIEGKEYYVYPDSYGVREAQLIAVIKNATTENSEQ